jgi:Holliday junction resolvase-like predicted endonuclease
MDNNNLYNKEFGKKGEDLIRNLYSKKNFECIHQNLYFKGSELDLVFLKEKEIHFVEVKTIKIISHVTHILPEDNFTWQKQKHFKRGIEIFLAKNRQYRDYEIKITLACVYHQERAGQWSVKLYENLILE